MPSLCERCGVDLKCPPSWGKRFCSQKCKRNERTIPCPKCGDQFQTWDAIKAPKTCGKLKCAQARILSQASKESIRNKLKKDKPIPACVICNALAASVKSKYCENCKPTNAKSCIICDSLTSTAKSKYCDCCRPPFRATVDDCRKGAYASLKKRTTSSKIEQNLRDKLGDLVLKCNDRETLSGLEIDILLDDKIAVEYRGMWHYGDFHKHYHSTVERDLRKESLIKERGLIPYIVGWALSGRPPKEFLDRQAYFIRQLYEEVSPFIFHFDRNLFKKEYLQLCNNKTGEGYACYNVVDWYHKHRWFMHSKHSMSSVDKWAADQEIVVANRLKHSDLSPRSLRRYFLLFGHAPGTFPESLVKRLLSCLPGKTVFDPFAGFGNRMLGSCASGWKYVGYDLEAETANGNVLMAHDLGLDALVVKRSSVGSDLDADALITSPPYFNREKYGSEFGYSDEDDYYDQMRETFRNVRIRNAVIDVKAPHVDVDRFLKILPWKKSIVVDKNFGGLGYSSKHQLLFCGNYSKEVRAAVAKYLGTKSVGATSLRD